MKPHVFDPAHIAVLESQERKIWQDPNEILKAVDPKPDWVAADLGCGSGYFTVPLSRMVRKVYGIDVQKEMLAFLEQKIERQKIENIEPMLSKPDEIPLENNSVDLLISVNTLHEFGDREKMIRKMRRVVKKGGRLLIVDFKKEDTGFGPPVRIRIPKPRAIKLFEAKGFALLKTKELQYHYLLVFAKE